MEHISSFLFPALETTMRQHTICEFITELRAARGLPPISAKELEIAGFAWDKVLFPIHEDYLSARDDGSLFVDAARRGCVDAPGVWNIWDAGAGALDRLDAQQEAERRTENGYLREPAPNGPGRQALLEYLRERGIGEAELSALGKA